MSDDGFRDACNEITARVARDQLFEIRNAVWDGTGLTLEEIAREGPENVVWRDLGMTIPELLEFLSEEAD
jgi:hypothetical protein